MPAGAGPTCPAVGRLRAARPWQTASGGGTPSWGRTHACPKAWSPRPRSRSGIRVHPAFAWRGRISPVKTPPPFALHLRPATPDDDAFLFTLYASTREQQLAAWGWTPAQGEPFLRMQYQAQARHYAAKHPPEGHAIIERDGAAVGRQWLVRTPAELLLVDVALLPSQRGAGLGTHLLNAMQAEAARARVPMRLHVTRDNPALRLYTRHGFTPVPGSDPASPYLELQWWAPEGDSGTGVR
ncbi:N-acetyltransferase [Corallococcus carmarthensis]|uniref:N-acetyltransferase n=1 Tax=Corallococcus carmarthensis TaxID=2316728 RepID=A0A3A8JSV9_9BACT|nr:N-acetyltransferase [Corallococcus carmarthensis]